MKDKLKDIIISSYNKALSERKEFYLNGAMIQVVDPLTNSINLNQIVEFLKKKIPEYILSLVDVYYIGNFDVFKRSFGDYDYVTTERKVLSQPKLTIFHGFHSCRVL